MVGAASKSGSSMLGGRGKETEQKSTYSVEQDINDHGENLVAGVIGKTGEVVDETGKTVGKVTEGEAGELVGNVVTATGDIIGKDGGVIGKALPLGELTESGESKQGGGSFTIMGATKGVKGIVDTVDGTVQTVNRTLPLVGDLTKGIGLGEGQGGVLGGVLGGGQDEKASQGGLLGGVTGALGGGQSEKGGSEQNPLGSLLGGVLGQSQSGGPLGVLGGTEPLERDQSVTDKDENLTQMLAQQKSDVDDKASLTENAKQNLFEVNDTTSEVAPIDLQDTEKPQADDGKPTTGGENTQTETEDSQGAKTDLTEQSTVDGNDELQEVDAEPIEEQTEGAETVKDDATEKAGTVPDDIATLDVPISQIPDDLKSELPEDLQTADIPVSQIPFDAQSKLPTDLASKLPSDLGSEVPEDAKTGTETPKGTTTEDWANQQDPANQSQVPEDAETGEFPEGVEDAEDAAEDAKTAKTGDVPDIDVTAASDSAPKSTVKDDIKSILSTVRSAIPEDQRTVTVAGDKLLQPFEKFPGAEIDDEGKVIFDNASIGRIAEGDPADLVGMTIDAEGNVINERGSIIGKAELKSEVADELLKDTIDFSILKGAKVNKAGNLVNEKGEAVGRIVSGILKHLIGRKADERGEIWNDAGKIIGKAEPIPEIEREELAEPAPFEDFPGATVESNGHVMFNGDIVGRVVEGDPKKLKGKKVDDEGDILDKSGNAIGKAERWEPESEPEPEPEVVIDNSALAGKRVNKAGNVVDKDGTIYGRIVEGDVKKLIGRMCDKEGNVRSESGDIIGRAELIPESEREGAKEGPFAELPGCTVAKDGTIVTPSGDIVGRLTQGDAKALFGRPIDEDGDILDRNGNLLGKAERWEPEAAPEREKGPMEGRKVNRSGEVVDEDGDVIGKLTAGEIKACAGKPINEDNDVVDSKGRIVGHVELLEDVPQPKGPMEGKTVNKKGEVVSDTGELLGKLTSGEIRVCAGKKINEDNDVVDSKDRVVGHVDLLEDIPEPKGPMEGKTVNKKGDVVSDTGEILGKLTSGELSVCAGKKINEDNDVVDSKDRVVGHVSLLEDLPQKKGPMEGRRVNRQGDVVDEDGNIIGKLTTGEVSICSGKEINSDNDVIDSKDRVVGHVSLLEDIPEVEVEEEPAETEEEKKAREELEADRKLARSLGGLIEQGLDRLRPLCKMITQKIEAAERKPKEERDEEQLVKDVKPLIEEGGKILTELNGSVRALDPDGRIQQNAKSKSQTREASPEEHHLAECLKELTGTITETVEGAKRKIEDMPHAKKELSPLWGLLTEPLFQILAAVGLLLTGVLNLVGRLLNGLGLGKIVDGLLGTLGLNRLLDGLGLGSLTAALGGGKKK
ncbi:LEA domain-containing protein [Colletotrichum cereale]|nr:LEA domain-containing protein [Colletotrichum cereale]